MSVWACACEFHACGGPWIWVGVTGSYKSPHMGAGIELGSSARTVRTLNNWAISPAPEGSFKYSKLKWISNYKISLYLQFPAWGFPCSKLSIFLDLSLTLEVERISEVTVKKRRLLKCNRESLKSSMICQSMDTCSFYKLKVYTDSTTLKWSLTITTVGSLL